ncbi:MAG: PEGA domain-containing protein [Ignavibacteria bacterium]|nr:PEGA domain-containing protein [Ignavibacteria bacterium]
MKSFGTVSMIMLLIGTFAHEAGAWSDSTALSDTADAVFITVVSNADGAEVLLDGASVGMTPLKDHRTTPGNHLLKLINKNRLGSWQNENLEIELDLKSDTLISAIFPYYYEFRSSPSNANVFRNDTLLGNTPLRFRSDYQMGGTLLFRRKDYRDLLFDMSSYDPLTGANVILKKSDNSVAEKTVMKNKGTQFKTSRNLAAILGLATVSLAAGYFAFDFKDKANDQYDKYLFTGNKESLDESRKYDKYFAAGLVLMQAALGGLVYFVFFD